MHKGGGLIHPTKEPMAEYLNGRWLVKAGQKIISAGLAPKTVCAKAIAKGKHGHGTAGTGNSDGMATHMALCNFLAPSKTKVH